MTKEQIAAIAVVLLLGAVFFVRLYGAEAKVTGKQWECPWCGDCGWIK